MCSGNSKVEEYHDFLKNKYKEGKPWQTEAADNRRLTELIELWYNAKGADLSDGFRRKLVLLSIAGFLDNPIARELTIKDFNQYKAIKKAGSTTEKPIMDKTVNNHLSYLRAMYNTLIKTKEIRYRNPLEEAEMIKTQQPELAYLTTEQVQTLLSHIDKGCSNPHVGLISRLCLSTGARWGEVESRKLYHFKDCRVQYSNTKGKRIRSIPVEPDLFDEITAHLKVHKRFWSSLGAFRRALKRSGIQLP
ncbi:phage integrase [Endozoicomonas acroporae]|uniref:phage integrase n=1 Tax=Endozoicomonas acroporae TaxID=1701104 RepID=UPI003D7BDCAB